MISAAGRARAWLELTKPGITLFIGITALAGFITALGEWTMTTRLALTVAATMLLSAGAAVLNHVAERRSDALMRRTAARPLPSGVVSVRAAREFGWSLSAAGLVISLIFLPWLAVLFLVLCHVTYLYAYTPLKQRTPLCTLIGAVPGALPVLAGWSATGQPVNVAAFALTGLLFMWQIPHFLAIGWLGRSDYRTAGCPMLGVEDDSGRASARVSLIYALAMLVCALVVGTTTGAGPVYTAIALPASIAYAGFALLFLLRREHASARRLFFSSLVVLPIVLSALVTALIG